MDYGSAVLIDDLAVLALDVPGPAAAAVYDRQIGLKLLHQDSTSGEEHYLVRYPAGLRGRCPPAQRGPHHRCTGRAARGQRSRHRTSSVRPLPGGPTDAASGSWRGPVFVRHHFPRAV